MGFSLELALGDKGMLEIWQGFLNTLGLLGNGLLSRLEPLWLWLTGIFSAIFNGLWFALRAIKLDNIWQNLASSFSGEQGSAYASALIKILVGLLLARLARTFVMRGFRRSSPQHRMLIRRTISYGIFTLFLISALDDINFPYEWLLGAAGILTIAIGFASQTSVSNLISGLFLLAEHSLEVGEIVKVDDVIGEVLSVDLLSTKLRTFDNLLVRIPNETMVKSKITNMSRLPIRRLDLKFNLSYQEDLSKVGELLDLLADKHPLALEEPAPQFFILGFSNAGVEVQFSVWAMRDNWLSLKNELHEEIKEAFAEKDIRLAYPRISLHSEEDSKLSFNLNYLPESKV
ncbi:MAG: mechanosensitive ion channel family protein [Deinococcales bacterium]